MGDYPCIQKLMAFAMIPAGVETQRDMQLVVLCEVGIRFVCAVFSTLGFLMIGLFTHYNRDQYKKLAMGDLSRFCMYLAFATITECLNLLAMETYFRRIDLSVLSVSGAALFKQRRFFYNCIGVCTTLLINIIYPE